MLRKPGHRNTVNFILGFVPKLEWPLYLQFLEQITKDLKVLELLTDIFFNLSLISNFVAECQMKCVRADLLGNYLKTSHTFVSSEVPAQKTRLNSEVMEASCVGVILYKWAFSLWELLRAAVLLTWDLGSHSMAVNTFTKKSSWSSCVVTLFHTHICEWMHKCGKLKPLNLPAKAPSTVSVNRVNNSGKICQSFGKDRQENIKGVKCSLLPLRNVASAFYCKMGKSTLFT